MDIRAQGASDEIDSARFPDGAGGVVAHKPSHAQDHDHDHDHDHQAVPSDLTLRVKALESLLVEKGLVDRAALDALVDTYEHKVGPRNGARVVARAWVDPAYKKRLLTDADRRDRGARLRRRAGRAHGGGGEHAEGAQPGRLHAVLLLSVAGARPAAGLVQVRALSLAAGDRSARRAARVRPRAAGGRRGARLGQHGGAALPGAAGAAGRHARD